MSELILKTNTGAEFWRDETDCSDERFNVFYFAHGDDEQPQAVASDCAEYCDAFDALAGYVPEDDLEALKVTVYPADSIEIDQGSHEVFGGLVEINGCRAEFKHGRLYPAYFSLYITSDDYWVTLNAESQQNYALGEESITATIEHMVKPFVEAFLKGKREA